MNIFLVVALLQPLACRPLHSDWIYGRDLAAAAPELAQLPPDLPISLSPVPGQPRVFHAGDLLRLATANHLPASVFTNICFAWAVSIPTRENLAAAMDKTLEGRKPRIEIIDQSRIPAPEGEIVFPLSGLSAVSDRPVIWRGYVQYAGKRSFPIWVRARITVEEPRVIAAADLAPGEPIRAGQLKGQAYSGPLSPETFLSDLSKAVGYVPRRFIAAGASLTASMIEPPHEVERGDLIEVIVQDGAARVETQGVAEQSGQSGDIILVKNAKTGRTYRARVQQKDIVVVMPGNAMQLVPEDTKS